MTSGPYLVAIVFWIFVAVAAVAGIVGDYKKRKLTMDVLKTAIERGQPLDPDFIAKLTRDDRDNGEMLPKHLQTGGIITIASGIGVGIFSFFIARLIGEASFALLGIGVLAACVGIGLLIAARRLATSNEKPNDSH